MEPRGTRETVTMIIIILVYRFGYRKVANTADTDVDVDVDVEDLYKIFKTVRAFSLVDRCV